MKITLSLSPAAQIETECLVAVVLDRGDKDKTEPYVAAADKAVQAAPADNPYCKMAAGQKNLVAWNAYYHCLGPAPRPARVVARPRAEPPKDPMCKLAPAQKNLVAWNSYYHCLGPAPRAAAPARRVYASAGRQQAKDPYCNMAAGQKNLVSWNAYYHCLSS